MSVDPKKLQIINYPHPILRKKAHPVDPIDDIVIAVAQRMLELMHEAGGVGLAAPQVSLDWRLFVANESGEQADDRIYINPVLSDPSAESHSHEEGCLSIPQVTGLIMRPTAITITAQDTAGRTITDTSETLAARIWQHETDHLNGVLIIDRMTQIDKMANKRLLKELEEAFTG